jgi:DNA-binding CsgD family transcriptional regulator
VDAFLGGHVSGDEWLQWGILAQMAAMAVWDFDSWITLSTRHVEIARASGALAPLSIALNGRGMVATLCGEFETATSMAAEKDVINEVTGIRLAATCDLLLAGYRGRRAEAVPLFAATTEEAVARGEGLAVQMAARATAVLHIGRGRYTDALHAAEKASEETYQPLSLQLALPDLVEAAVQTGHPELARESLERLSTMTIAESDWAAGLDARSRALLSDGHDAERCYIEAVERFGRTPLRPELARTHLLYGEWCDGEGRRADARRELRTAHDLFAAMGAEAFAERARRELAGTGERIRRHEVDAPKELTAQEEHIARLARDRHTNPEIAATLFLSTRTIEWHLRKIFGKLGISSRKELDHALSSHGRRSAVGSRRRRPDVPVLLTEYGVAAIGVHRGFAAGRYRDWSWSEIWTDVSRCASSTFTAVAAGCTCGWRGPAHRPRDGAPDACRWEWVFLHVVTLSWSAVDGIAQDLSKGHLRISGLQAALHRGSDSALHLGGAHRLAEDVGITAEVLGRRERDRVDALLDRDMADRRESCDPVSERSDEVVELVGRHRSVDPAVPLGQLRVVVLRAQHDLQRSSTTHETHEVLGGAPTGK